MPLSDWKQLYLIDRYKRKGGAEYKIARNVKVNLKDTFPDVKKSQRGKKGFGRIWGNVNFSHTFSLSKFESRHWLWDTLMKEIEIMKIAVIKWSEKHIPYIDIWDWRSPREVTPKIEKNVSIFTRLHRGKYVNMSHWSEMKNFSLHSHLKLRSSRGDS